MTVEMEKEILRLVNEIAEDEIKIADAEADALRTYITDSSKEKYKETAKNLARGVERKIELLRILKEA